jgi:hypothetical protein
MDEVEKYLMNPMQTGVYNAIFLIDFSELANRLSNLSKKFNDSAKDLRGQKRSILKNRSSTLAAAASSVQAPVWRTVTKDAFNNLLNSLALYCCFSEDTPEEIRKTCNVPMDFWRRNISGLSTTNLFKSGTVKDFDDQILIDKKQISTTKWAFDVLAMKKGTVDDFKRKIELIPALRICVKKEKQHFSMRYSYRLYPWIVKFWATSDISIPIQSDIKSFLSTAADYYFSGEWRTSIVFSSIAIESVLADLFEESYREIAPDTPLGDLFRRVSERMEFPDEIKKAVELANSARIAAVHRSRLPVSDREAVNALFGATNFIIWNEIVQQTKNKI